jgi:hypothetical protein
LYLSALVARGLLTQVREAVIQKSFPADSEIRLTGTCRYLGGDGKYAFTFDKDGRFLQKLQSPAGEIYGCDGSTYWKQDHTGAPIKISFEARAEAEALATLISDDWLLPSNKNQVQERGNQLDLLLGPEKFAIHVQLDSATSLPQTATINTPADLVTIKLSDWHKVGGRMLPFQTEVQRVGASDTLTVTSASVGADEADLYKVPEMMPQDTTFDSSKSAEVECKRAPSGHMLVHPLVNGKDVGWFILDSGAETMCVNPSVAKTLNLKQIGLGPGTGVGGSLQMPIFEANSLELGRFNMNRVEMIGFDLSPLSAYFGVTVAGIVGYDMFRRSVVEFQLAPARVAVYDPKTYDKPTPGWAQLKFDGGNSAVQAKAEGKPGWYRVDTGDDGSVAFEYPYVMHEDMLKGRRTRKVTVGGAGGSLDILSGQISSFEVGGVTMRNIPATFVNVDKGSFTDIFLAGNLGQGPMMPFTLVFDYRNYRLGFRPVGKNGLTRFMSGSR